MDRQTWRSRWPWAASSSSGPLLTILKLAPVTNPIHAPYRRWPEENGFRHLIA